MLLNKSRLAGKLSSGSLKITPHIPSNVGEYDYILHMGAWVHQLIIEEEGSLDTSENQEFKKCRVSGGTGTVLQPGVYLVETKEEVQSRTVICLVHLVQNLQRLGIICSGGFVDTGYSGKLVIPVVITFPIKVYPGLPFVRLSVADCGVAANKNYKGIFNKASIITKKFKRGN